MDIKSLNELHQAQKQLTNQLGVLAKISTVLAIVGTIGFLISLFYSTVGLAITLVALLVNTIAVRKSKSINAEYRKLIEEYNDKFKKEFDVV